MRIWENIRKWGRGLVNRAATATGVAREFKDIFELGGVPALRRFYDEGVFMWKALYRGYYDVWHEVPAPTIANPKARRKLYRLNAAKAVSAEMASLVWGEECDVRVSTHNWEEKRDENGVVTNPDPLAAFISDVLRRNAFHEKMQELIEQGLALGGASLKVWGEKRDGDQQHQIRLGYVMADQFVPIAWDNAQVSEGVFVSRCVKNGFIYTRLEWHRRKDAAYIISNELYRADIQRGATTERADVLGVRCSAEEMASVYPGLAPETVAKLDESLFSYWRTPIANNLDDNSPLGISCYANALETLHAIDICYDSFVTEFELGKKRIIVPARCVRTVADPSTGEMRRYFDPGDRIYEAMATDDVGNLKIQDNSVELRVEEHIAALNAFLSILCLQLGFSANTFSFDQQAGIKTATEVISENSKTYKTIRNIKNQLTPALEHLVKNIIDTSVLYDLQWQGQSVKSLIEGGYDVKVVFDDSVTQDRQSNLNEGVMLVGAGVLSKHTLLTDRKYGIGMTDQEAVEELRRIAEENRTNATVPPLG